ncbi:MAG: nitrite/sulfite reductase, partial [Turicibacter sp.]
MDHLKQQLLEEIPEFRAVGEKFLSGELSKMDFKKISGGFGVYAHRDGSSFMIRLRILSGMLSKEQLNQVYELSHKHQVKLIHLTTRQAIQFHHL